MILYRPFEIWLWICESPRESFSTVRMTSSEVSQCVRSRSRSFADSTRCPIRELPNEALLPPAWAMVAAGALRAPAAIITKRRSRAPRR